MDKLLEILKSPMKLGAYAILAVMAWGLVEYGSKVFNGGKEVFNAGVAYSKMRTDIDLLQKDLTTVNELIRLQRAATINQDNKLCWLAIDLPISKEAQRKICAGTQIKP